MIEVLYIILYLLLLYISYKDIKDGYYKTFIFYIILFIITIISYKNEVFYIKILSIYLLLILSYLLKSRYIDKIGDGDIDLYLSLYMMYSFEKFLYLVIISTLSAIFISLIKNDFKSVKESSVRLIPYITFAFFTIEIYTYLRAL